MVKSRLFLDVMSEAFNYPVILSIISQLCSHPEPLYVPPDIKWVTVHFRVTASSTQLKLFLRLNHLQVTMCSSTCGKTSASVHQFLTGTCIINRLLCVLVCTLHGLLHTLSQGPLTECSTNEETEPQSVGNMTELWLDIIDPYEILRSHPVFVPFYLLPHCASGRFSKHGTGYGKDVTRMLTAMECAVRSLWIRFTDPRLPLSLSSWNGDDIRSSQYIRAYTLTKE